MLGLIFAAPVAGGLLQQMASCSRWPPVAEEGWLLDIPKRVSAVTLYKLLHNRRLIDTQLKLAFVRRPGGKVRLKEDDLKAVEPRVQKVLDLYNNHTKHLIKADLDKALDVYSYKMQKCPVKYCSATYCPFFHNLKDRRRDPRHFSYRYRKCGGQ
ncbi:hypothetical protein FHG87_023663, partial [Trinorchestia longiramus]